MVEVQSIFFLLLKRRTELADSPQALFRAYFEGAKDISHRDVLTKVASEAGFDAAKVQQMLFLSFWRSEAFLTTKREGPRVSGERPARHRGGPRRLRGEGQAHQRRAALHHQSP